MSKLRQALASADKATLGTIAAGMLAQLGLVVSGIIAARALGPSDRGYLAAFQAIAVAASFILALGVPVAVAYYVARDEGIARGSVRRLRKLIALQLFAAVLVPALVFLVAFADDSAHAREAAWLTLPMTAALLIAMYATSYLQGLQRFLAYNLFRTIPIPIYGATLIVLVLIGLDDLLEFAVAYTVIVSVAALLGVVIVLRWLPPEGGEDISAGTFLSYGLKGQIGSVSPLEVFQVDYLVVGAIAGPYWLGLYAGAMAFTNLPRFVAMGIGVVAFPRVAAARGTDHAVRSAVDAVALITAFAAVVVIILELIVGWLIPFLFGDAFEASVPIARVLLISALLLSVRRVIGDVMRGGGAPLPSTSAEVLSWVVYAIAVAPLVHEHGALGAAWAMTAAADVSTAYLSYVALQMLRRIRLDQQDD
ncbi:MAG: oligosaccharide flippase family protein [Thermoleophilaceae bacterium]|nr:oligosaccharide flippase family protein [Thermoleophilaceae bacterium]